MTTPEGTTPFKKKDLNPMYAPDAVRRMTGLKHLEPPTDAEREEDSNGTNGTNGAGRSAYHFTELGNAVRLFDAHRGDIRFSPALGFCAWREAEGRWRVNDALVVCRWAQDTIVALYREGSDMAKRAAELAEAGDEETSKVKAGLASALLAWAKASQRASMVSAMLTLIQPHVEIQPGEFDAHRWLFNCPNGTINFETGELQPHRRADYLTQRSPIRYNPEATCPRFLQFLDEITAGWVDGKMALRPGLRDYVLRVLAYALTGDTSEQLWHLLLGKGENGKTTLMELLAFILGDYAGMLEPESVTVTKQVKDGSAPSPEIAGLRGKRLTRITETEEGARLSAQRVKKFSGEDVLKGRFLHKDPFDFLPVHKLFIYTNHRPQTRDTSHAFWRRVRVIPFELDLEQHPELKDPKLMGKLRGEAEGILALLVREGMAGYQERGLVPPPEVREATDRYKHESDVLSLFLTECCVVGPAEEDRAQALYTIYKLWAEERGEHPWGIRRFGEALAEKGFKTRESHGIIRLGLRLRMATDTPNEEAE